MFDRIGELIATAEPIVGTIAIAVIAIGYAVFVAWLFSDTEMRERH